ncbi:MAG: cobyric acid synthase [Lachnospiraceae bacterium]|nr:cobyric acid synthase [Lachnospiraceae bacterium]
MKAKNLMIQGTMSGVGKSLLVTALCRIFAEDGVKVCPFKSQNMALNSFVTADGLEMGRAQAEQAFAAGLQPDVRMNPILLKPSADSESQVILNGKVLRSMNSREYFKKRGDFMQEILKDLDSLSEEYELIIAEGAGSPAEINLKKNDIVNMGLAKAADMPVILAGDIDRGGVFAQCLGTVEWMEKAERDRIKGFVFNKFRGDPTLLSPGPEMLFERTGIPLIGVVPYVPGLEIDDEDSISDRLKSTGGNNKDARVDIAVVRLPRISNFTDIIPLEDNAFVSVRYVESPERLGNPDLIILPGTKTTISDLRWMKQNALYDAVLGASGNGSFVFGICGGYQMLGKELQDPYGEDGGGKEEGLGLLPVSTVFSKEKNRRQIKGKSSSGASVEGYEIHMGESEIGGDRLFTLDADGRQFPEGCITDTAAGTYVHGLFDTGEFADELIELVCKKRNIDFPKEGKTETKRQRFERSVKRLADSVRASVDMDKIREIAGL